MQCSTLVYLLVFVLHWLPNSRPVDLNKAQMENIKHVPRLAVMINSLFLTIFINNSRFPKKPCQLPETSWFLDFWQGTGVCCSTPYFIHEIMSDCYCKMTVEPQSIAEGPLTMRWIQRLGERRDAWNITSHKALDILQYRSSIVPIQWTNTPFKHGC